MAGATDRTALVAAAGETIRSGSKSFHMASHLFDRATRERAWLLYRWCRHCDDGSDGQTLGHSDPHKVGGRVSQVEALTARTLVGEKTGLPAFDGLGVVLAECPIPHHFVIDHLRGFRLDADGWQPQSKTELLAYCYHVAGVVGCMMAVVMGVDPQDEDTLACAADLGIAFQLANIAWDVRDDHEAGRCYLPGEWMKEHKLDPSNPLRPEQRQHLVAVVARLTSLSERYEASARAGIPKLPFRARWAVLAASHIYGAIGRRVAALGTEAWEKRVVVRRHEKLAFLIPSLLQSARAGRES